jgi:hypothetical protein
MITDKPNGTSICAMLATLPEVSNCTCGHSVGVHYHTNHLASCALCDCKKYERKLITIEIKEKK